MVTSGVIYYDVPEHYMSSKVVGPVCYWCLVYHVFLCGHHY